MIHLIYVSSATKEMNSDDLFELLNQARERNERHCITGMLLYGKQNFIQVLEGEACDVDSIYSSILKDTRNQGNIVIQRKAIRVRNFPDWSMGFSNLNDKQIAEVEGYSHFFENESCLEAIAEQSKKVAALLSRFKNSVQ